MCKILINIKIKTNTYIVETEIERFLVNMHLQNYGQIKIHSRFFLNYLRSWLTILLVLTGFETFGDLKIYVLNSFMMESV